MTKITDKGLENSVGLVQMASAKITLSNNKTIVVTNPVSKIVELFQYVENPKNRFTNISGIMVNINQIASMQWINEPTTTMSN